MALNESRYGDYGVDFERTKTPPGLDATTINQLNQALQSNPTRTVDMPNLTGTANDLALPSDVLLFRIQTDGLGAKTITGFANVFPGRVIYMRNVGGQNITLAEQNAGSQAQHRISTGGLGDLAITSAQVAVLIYDSVQQRWVFVSRSQ